MTLTPMLHAPPASMYLSDSVFSFVVCAPSCNESQTEEVVRVVTLYSCIQEVFVCDVGEGSHFRE
jgi:hypothetical protein